MTFSRPASLVTATVFAAGALLLALPACGDKDPPYVPQAAHSGKPVKLPDVPTLPAKPTKVGDAYTVWGAVHSLRSVVHIDDVRGKDITILGYIVKTNLADAPACSVHKTGKGDTENCKPPIPAFWIADEKGDVKNAIKVMGFASNFAQLYDAIEKDKKAKDTDPPTQDEFLGLPLPRPIPNVDGKVKVTGNYGFAYTKATSGIETDPRFGVLTYAKIEYVEKPPTPATLPGMK
jgi:predicted small lipoprotein YifL